MWKRLSIVIGPQLNWKGKIVVDGDESVKLPGLGVELRASTRHRFPVRAYVDENLEFTLPFLPQETYDLEFLNAPEDVYLEAVRLGKNDHLASGLEAEPGAAPQEMEVVLSTRGGKVLGRAVTAADSNVVATGASVLLIPDPPIGRTQAYKLAYADQYGNFLVHGVAPGNYIVVAWFDQPPCEVYNPDDLAACRAQGVKLAISDDALESIQSLTARRIGAEQATVRARCLIRKSANSSFCRHLPIDREVPSNHQQLGEVADLAIQRDADIARRALPGIWASLGTGAIRPAGRDLFVAAPARSPQFSPFLRWLRA